MKKQLGFTIVEILIAVAVIAILASIVVVSYDGTRNEAKDASRLNDAQVITDALELYGIDNGKFPSPTSSNGSWEQSNEDDYQGGDFLETLQQDGYLTEVPLDPENDDTRFYSYYRYGAGNHGCDLDRGAYFVFGIKDLEAEDERPADSSPGWSCLNRDWEDEFDWVTGGFTN